VDCVERGTLITVELGGSGGGAPVFGGGGGHTTALITALPAMGRVLRPATAVEAAAAGGGGGGAGVEEEGGNFVEMTSAPAAVSGSRRRIIYEAPPPPSVEITSGGEGGGGGSTEGTTPECAAISYRVRGYTSDATSAPSVAYVDVMPLGGCTTHPGGGGGGGGGVPSSRLARGTCTEMRSRLEYAAANVPAPAASVVIPMYNGANATLEVGLFTLNPT
jgi:hypothetical protein